MRYLLCLLGFHEWADFRFDSEGYSSIHYVQACEHCDLLRRKKKS